MRETLFKFLLSEIKAVRISCQRQDGGEPCGGIIEVSIGRMSKIGKCPVCCNDFTGHEHLGALKKAIQDIVAAKMDLAFILPTDALDAPPPSKK